MSNKIQNQSKVITGPNTVFSYLNCWEPKALTENATPKYSASLIIKKSDIKTIDKIKKAIEYAYKEGESKLKGMVSQYLHFLYLKHLFVMVTQKDLMMRLIRVAILLMQIQFKLPVS